VNNLNVNTHKAGININDRNKILAIELLEYPKNKTIIELLLLKRTYWNIDSLKEYFKEMKNEFQQKNIQINSKDYDLFINNHAENLSSINENEPLNKNNTLRYIGHANNLKGTIGNDIDGNIELEGHLSENYLHDKTRILLDLILRIEYEFITEKEYPFINFSSILSKKCFMLNSFFCQLFHTLFTLNIIKHCRFINSLNLDNFSRNHLFSILTKNIVEIFKNNNNLQQMTIASGYKTHAIYISFYKEKDFIKQSFSILIFRYENHE